MAKIKQKYTVPGSANQASSSAFIPADRKRRLRFYAVTRMEQDFSTTLTSQGKTLEEQQRTLTAHSQDMRQLQEKHSQFKADLQALTRRLEDLAALYRNLEALLSLFERDVERQI